jgi:methylmalonyl-CoA mutase C-terminal domain/subunit
MSFEKFSENIVRARCEEETAMDRRIRVLVAKPGLDGHDRGAKIIARALRDAGMEVVYTGIRQSPDQIADAAVQEDVDVVALSSLSGAHNTLFPRVVDALRRRGASDILVIGGGIIPDEDIPRLKSCGIAAVFGPGTNTNDVAAYIKAQVGST